MPSERRLIRFSKPEVEAALRHFADSQDRALPEGKTKAVDLRNGGEEGVSATLAFEDVKREAHFTALEMAAALIAYCREVKVPIPRQGRKSVHAANETVTLQIDVARR